jgi:hypothetical protein
MKYYKLRAVKSFLWKGNDGMDEFVKKGEIIEADATARRCLLKKNLVVDEP